MENNYEQVAVKEINYDKIYSDQAGGALNPYVSYRHLPYQRGRGFFGRVIKGSIMPLLKSVLPYLKDRALEGMEGVVDGIKSGETIKQAGTNQLKKTTARLATDVATRMKGSGVKKRSLKSRKIIGITHKRRTKKKNMKRKVPQRSRNSSKKRSVLFNQ